MSIRLLYLSVCLFFLPLQAEAHKIHVFAWVSGEIVTVESGFSGNKPLLHAKITVKDTTSGDVIVTGNGDAKGMFTFTVPSEARTRKSDLLIIVKGGEGHQSEWLLPADEYLSALISDKDTDHQTDTVNTVELQRMIRKIVTQELAPIKRSLAESRQDKPDFRDVTAGIGFLLGLAGLISWTRNRKARKTETDA